MNGSDVRLAAQRVNDHPATTILARLGYVASGVLHVVLGLISIQVAWFRSDANADQSGAFAALAEQPLGKLALWVVALGFAGLAIWHVTEAVSSGAGAGDRVKAASKAVFYAFLGWTSMTFAQGGPGSGGDPTEDLTATLMSRPGGRIAVGVVGLVVIGIAIYHLHKGWSKKFLRDLTENPGRFVTGAGRLGYVAKGVALAVVGALFITAAMRAQPEEAGGLDAALRTLGEQPFGAFLLTVVAAGFLGYGVYSFARARYTRT